MRKFNFSNRIIPIWNSLPDYVVASPTINTFEAHLDKFRENQDVRYNWKAVYQPTYRLPEIAVKLS